jgi:hypothetical protein
VREEWIQDIREGKKKIKNTSAQNNYIFSLHVCIFRHIYVELQKAPVNFVTSICSSVCMHQLNSGWVRFGEM